MARMRAVEALHPAADCMGCQSPDSCFGLPENKIEKISFISNEGKLLRS